MQDKIKYYFVPPDKIGWVLVRLNSYGWKFDLPGTPGLSIESQYYSATSRDWDGHKCIFKIEQWTSEETSAHYKFIQITSDLLMKSNNQNHEIESFDEFKKRLPKMLH